MFRKALFGAFTLAVGLGAALAVKALKDSEKEETFDDDSDIHFVEITDEEEDEEVDEDDSEDPLIRNLEDQPEAIQEICGIYPFLDPDFVDQILSKNDELNEAYKAHEKILIRHEAVVRDEAAITRLEEILEDAGYICDRNQSVLIASNTLETNPGAIISDVLNVANQIRALQGIYNGFAIEVNQLQ